MPVPPARPVVSVSRKAHLVGWRAGDGAGGERVEQIFGKLGEVGDVDAAVAAVGFSQSFSVSKCWPSGVVTTSPESRSSMNSPPGVAGGRGGGAGVAYLRSTRAMRLAQGGELFLDILHASLFLCLI